MEAFPNQTSSFLQEELKQEENNHKHNHVHIHNHVKDQGHDHVHKYTHLHTQLEEHLTTAGNGVAQEICQCQLEEMLQGDVEEARHEKVKAKIEERKKRAEGQKGVSDVTDRENYDIDEALLFIEGEQKSSNLPCLKRDAKYGGKKKECKNMQKAEMLNNSDTIDSDDESVKTMEEPNICTVEEEDHVEHCHNDQNDWTEVNMRKKKKTSKKHDEMPHLFTIEDLSHNSCHAKTAPINNPRCQVENETLAKAQVWESCLFSPAEEPSKGLSEEDFPSLQSCSGRRKPGKITEKKVKVVKEKVLVLNPDQIDDGDEANAQEEKDEVIEQEVGEEDLEKRACEPLTKACLRDMFQFPGTLCFCFCDSGEISTVSNPVLEKQVKDPKVQMTRMHAMLNGLVVPFGKF